MGSAVIITGRREFDAALGQMDARALIAAKAIVDRGLVVIASEAKRTFRPRPGGQRTAKSGRIYYSFAPPFQAIPPQATSRSGNLQSSIGTVSGSAAISGGWSGFTGTEVKYAAYVEYGTSRMRAEPFMEQGLERSRGALQAIAETEWAKAVA